MENPPVRKTSPATGTERPMETVENYEKSVTTASGET